MFFLKRFFPPPNSVFTDPDYQAAYRFKDAFVPEQNKDYEWVGEYAKFTFDQLQNADGTLDEKAESIIRVLGGGSGLLSLGAVLNLTKIGSATAYSLIVALCFALAAVTVAAWVRVPRNTLLPPSVAWALQYVSVYDKTSRDRFLAQWHLACEGIRLSIRAKAWGVKVATWLGVASVATMAISYCIAIATIPEASQTNEKGKAQMVQQESNPSLPQNQTTTPAANTPVPDPSGVPQTPSPQSAAGPQVIQKSADPASTAGPQTIQLRAVPPIQARESDKKQQD